jgi:HAD superfamily phosphoserine phosphatase-like hydrolase
MRIVLPNKTIERTPTFAGLCGTAHGHRWASDGDAKGCMVTPTDEMLAGSEPLSDRPFGLAVFDLDGTLLRGPTVCEVLARALGRLDHMRQLEALIAGLRDIDIAAAREEMVRWYREVSPADLTSRLGLVTLAPRATEGITLLRRHGVAVAIASITWEFAVAWFARQLHVDYYVGTRLEPDGTIRHFWPRDKVTWIQGLRDTLRIAASRMAGIGDSGGDVEMVRAVRHPVFVGATLPGKLPGVTHFPGTDIATVAHWIIERLTLEA